MASLWRALALVWLGGVASPALMDDAEPLNIVIEAPANPPGAVASSGESTGLSRDGKPQNGAVGVPPTRKAR